MRTLAFLSLPIALLLLGLLWLSAPDTRRFAHTTDAEETLHVQLAPAPPAPVKPHTSPAKTTLPGQTASSIELTGHFVNLVESIHWLERRGAALLLLNKHLVVARISLKNGANGVRLTLKPPPAALPQGVWRDATHDVTSLTGPLPEGNRIALVWPSNLWGAIKTNALKTHALRLNLRYAMDNQNMVISYRKPRSSHFKNLVVLP